MESRPLPYAVDATHSLKEHICKEAAPQLYVHACFAGGGGREEYRQTVALVATLG
jgi:hypothetical protein